MQKIIASLSMKRKSKAAKAKEKSPAAKTPDKSGKSTKKWRKKKLVELEEEPDRWAPPSNFKDGWASSSWPEQGTKNAEAFMKQYAELGPEGIKAEFKTEVEGWKSPTYADTAFHANPTKNADKKVTCLDDSRVIMAGNKYINASWAYDAEKNRRKFIIAQAPMQSTIVDFWQMIYEQKAVAVFALCKEEKSSKEKPEDPPNSIQIWPENDGESMNIGDITLLREEWSNLWTFRHDEITVSVKGRKEEHRMRVFHMRGGYEETDYQKTAKRIQRNLWYMDYVEGESRSGPLVLIDDHGGIGLVSILVVADMVGTLLWKGEKNVTIPAIVKWARRCRNGAIRDEDDYLMIVKAIAERINALEYNKYKETYEKICGVPPPRPPRRPRKPLLAIAPPQVPSPKDNVPSKEPPKDTASPSKEPSKDTASPSKEPSKDTASPSKEPSKDTASPSKEPSKTTASPSKETITPSKSAF